MPFRDIHDPRDPWAFRNTWTGEVRTSYEELWIVIPLIVLLTLCALGLIMPLIIHKYCRGAFPCPRFWRLFDRFLRVLQEIGKEKVMVDGFDNPAYAPAQNSQDVEMARPRNLMSLRSSVRYVRKTGRDKVNRSRSCPPPARQIVPRIKL
ncbi:hypothetical protein M3Y94_01124200 [Aphelenchoides besseyi]|nr:hypothetical protein M3Y94_01124200 [Aphelenchoides besseyi]